METTVPRGTLRLELSRSSLAPSSCPATVGYGDLDMNESWKEGVMGLGVLGPQTFSLSEDKWHFLGASGTRILAVREKCSDVIAPPALLSLF